MNINGTNNSWQRYLLHLYELPLRLVGRIAIALVAVLIISYTAIALSWGKPEHDGELFFGMFVIMLVLVIVFSTLAEKFMAKHIIRAENLQQSGEFSESLLLGVNVAGNVIDCNSVLWINEGITYYTVTIPSIFGERFREKVDFRSEVEGLCVEFTIKLTVYTINPEKIPFQGFPKQTLYDVVVHGGWDRVSDWVRDSYKSALLANTQFRLALSTGAKSGLAVELIRQINQTLPDISFPWRRFQNFLRVEATVDADSVKFSADVMYK